MQFYIQHLDPAHVDRPLSPSPHVDIRGFFGKTPPPFCFKIYFLPISIIYLTNLSLLVITCYS